MVNNVTLSTSTSSDGIDWVTYIHLLSSQQKKAEEKTRGSEADVARHVMVNIIGSPNTGSDGSVWVTYLQLLSSQKKKAEEKMRVN